MDLTPKQFEQLLCEFCSQDIPPTFTVEHDVREMGAESGNRRQIDTKIRGRLGISNILICGEAKYWDEPVGSETIDALVGKYLSGEIRANKVIMFSNKGYTSPAVTRAKLLGIELLEPKEIGNAIINIPYIVGVGYMGQQVVSISREGGGKIPTRMGLSPDDYTFFKGDERISYHQNFFRLIVAKLRKMGPKTIFDDVSKLIVEDKSALYALKQFEGDRYSADFSIEFSIKWDYFFEYLPAGILRHVNSDEVQFVNLQGPPADRVGKVLLSPTKGNYERREECIEKVVLPHGAHTLQLCMPDPDRHKTHPREPIYSWV